MTRMLLGEATPGVRAGGALCFFLDMPRLSATEPRKDRMPSRPSPAVQLAPCAGREALGWYDFTLLYPDPPLFLTAGCGRSQSRKLILIR